MTAPRHGKSKGRGRCLRALWLALCCLLPRPAAALTGASLPTPKGLRQATTFWTDLFLQHGPDQVVVVDRDHLQVIWRVLDLPKDARGRVREAAAGAMTRRFVADLASRLRRLEGDPRPLDDEDRAILMAATPDATAGNPPLATLLQGAAGRLRTQRGMAQEFQRGLTRAKPYLLRMRRIFRTAGVPEELVALPFVESMFNPRARSAVGAAGLWQLMPGTARELGLKVTKRRDERFDVLKSTWAAARLLRRNYRILGSWPLGVTAYNHGAQSVQRAVARVGSTELTDLIARYDERTWGFSSRNFYAEFLAARALLEAHEDAAVALARPARRR